MATFYIEQENGPYLSHDGTRRFIRLSGKRAYDYLRTAEGKRKRFFRTNAQEDDGAEIFIEIPAAHIRQSRKEERHAQYVSDCIEDSGMETVSLYSMETEETGRVGSGEELIADPSVSVENEVLHEIDLEILRRALKTLTDEELMIIHERYLAREPKTESEIARFLGLSQQAVARRISRILRKLKKFF